MADSVFYSSHYTMLLLEKWLSTLWTRDHRGTNNWLLGRRSSFESKQPALAVMVNLLILNENGWASMLLYQVFTNSIGSQTVDTQSCGYSAFVFVNTFHSSYHTKPSSRETPPIAGYVTVWGSFPLKSTLWKNKKALICYLSTNLSNFTIFCRVHHTNVFLCPFTSFWPLTIFIQ